MTALEIDRLSRTLKTTNNDLDGLPELKADIDVDGNPIADLIHDAVYLADVTDLIADRGFDIGDIASIACRAAERDAYDDAVEAYTGGEYDRVSIGVDANDGSETIRFDGGKVIIGVPLTFEVESFRSADVPAAAGHGEAA